MLVSLEFLSTWRVRTLKKIDTTQFAYAFTPMFLTQNSIGPDRRMSCARRFL